MLNALLVGAGIVFSRASSKHVGIVLISEGSDETAWGVAFRFDVTSNVLLTTKACWQPGSGIADADFFGSPLLVPKWIFSATCLDVGMLLAEAVLCMMLLLTGLALGVGAAAILVELLQPIRFLERYEFFPETNRMKHAGSIHHQSQSLTKISRFPTYT
jgi:hypothetical protein